MDQDTTSESPDPLSDDERQLVVAYRRCSQRRKDVVKRFALKLAGLEPPLSIAHQIITNVLPFPFKRRKDDN